MIKLLKKKKNVILYNIYKLHIRRRINIIHYVMIFLFLYTDERNTQFQNNYLKIKIFAECMAK